MINNSTIAISANLEFFEEIYVDNLNSETFDSDFTFYTNSVFHKVLDDNVN